MTVPEVLVVAGTRPEYQKLAPVLLALRAAGVSVAFLWTGQHADPAMTSAFAEGLGWPEPDGRIDWSGTIFARWARVRSWWEDAYGRAGPAMVLVQGDTDSARAGVYGALPWGPRTIIAHLEAGLRSWEPDLPEEANRRAIDSVADLLLCPSPLAAAHAKVDAKPGARIVVTGQTGLDALVAAIDRTPSPPPTSPPYALLTLHRAALADDTQALPYVLGAVSGSVKRAGLTLVWPVHPRVAARQGVLVEHIRNAGVSVIDPLPYREMAARLGGHDRPAIVISDSGGLIEEACYLGIPTVIVRPATERWELLTHGQADLVRPEHAAERLPGVVAETLQRGTPGGSSPYGEPRTRAVGATPTARAVIEIVRALKERP